MLTREQIAKAIEDQAAEEIKRRFSVLCSSMVQNNGAGQFSASIAIVQESHTKAIESLDAFFEKGQGDAQQ